MKTTSLDREIRARLDSFAAELSSLVRTAAVDSIHAALGAAQTTAVAAGAAAEKLDRKITRRRRGGKRTSESVLETAATVQAYIKSHAGERLEQIAKGLSMSSKDLKLPIQKLFAQKAIKTKGKKRGTMYFAK
ncbi:MAG: hypothetical protein IT454_19940 [Planctomycetes bacterium]|nr:hypothetical protein [Planctomycetota bacterium]